MKVQVRSVLVICLLHGFINIYAQSYSSESLLKNFSKLQIESLQEKIFLHTDRTCYVAGETIWFKIYYVDGYQHKLFDLSKVAYIELLDQKNNPVAQEKMQLQNGLGQGFLTILTTTSSGQYHVRAYTNWMKNFDPAFYFHQSITIVNTLKKPEVTKVLPNAKEFDIQFFPEGGNLILGLPSKIGVRAVDQNGNGLEFKGLIIDPTGDTITSFSSSKFGLGNFSFTPKQLDNYSAVLALSSGKKMKLSLPAIASSGYTINMIEKDNGILEIAVRSTAKDDFPLVTLFAHTRLAIKLTKTSALKNGTTVFEVNKNILDDGISHFTIFNTNNIPVGERLYFKQSVDTLGLSVKTDKDIYRNREKIIIKGEVKNQEQAGNFSISVSLIDSIPLINPVSLKAYLLLTSDLKGSIESPEYYFSDDPLVKSVTDDLMLTHGWSRFRWGNLSSKENRMPDFVPESRSHIITGILKNSAGTLPGTPIYLSSPSKKIQFYTSINNTPGKFLFETKNMIGKIKLHIQSKLIMDSSTMIETLNPFSEKFYNQFLSDITLSPKFKTQLTQRSIAMQVNAIYYPPIEKTSAYSDTSAFYGTAEESYRLDDYTRFPVMEEVMREYVKGVMVRKREGKFIFKIPDALNGGLLGDEPLILLDGVPVSNADKIMSLDPLKVKQLDIVPRRYFIGTQSFDGIVSYRTYTGDLSGFEIGSPSPLIDYEGLQKTKEFFSPVYETTEQINSRLPDARNLLYWNPNISSEDLRKGIEFYSSDQPGTYTILVHGIADGKAGSATTTLLVNKHK